MRRKIYDLCVNQNYTVKRKYEGFVLSHMGLHRRCRAVSWLYLLWLNFWFRVLHMPDRRRLCAKNESGTGFQYSAEETAVQLCRSDAVSFDMFDTLILRPFSAPADLFYLVGEKLNIPDFRSIRINAERTARERRQAVCGNGEVTLAEIYAVLAEVLGISAEQGMETEARIECELCMPNPFMLDVWKRVIAAGKRVIITTDMYLPRTVLENMLAKCGFTGYEALFLSNEHGCGKYNGQLFGIVRKSYPECRIAHIGDNRYADVVQAKKAGFDALHYPNLNEAGQKYRPENMSPLTGSAYRGLVNRRLYCGEACSPVFEYGYKCGGILMVGFCHFIHEQAQRTCAEKVLFFARDGYIMKKIYDRLYPDDATEYVYWSRAAAAKLCAQLYPQDYFRRFLDQKTGRGIPLGEIFGAMGLDAMQLPFAKEELLTEQNLPAVKAELYKRLDEIGVLYAPMYAQADRYLRQIMGDCRSAVTVDCGWAGSGSIFFEAYLQRKMGLSVEIVGLLAGSNSRNQIDSDFSETYFRTGKLVSYCFSAEHNREYFETHFPAKKHNIYFELLCGAPEPSFAGFDANGLTFDAESENAALIREIHAGEMAFAEDYTEAFSAYPYMLRISGSDAYAPFMGAVTGGEAYLRSVFDGCVFDETTGGRKEKL